MCGIIGTCGQITNVKKILIDGLQKLEYRGYDSAGIALQNNNKLNLYKKVGILKNLKKAVKNLDINSNCGIGHTRWATHGTPTENNCHPHISNNQKFSIVHNGIIENYFELKQMLEKKGFVFKTDTDSEIIACLLELETKNTFINTVTNAIKYLTGSFALAIISSEHPNQIVAVKQKSPLIICSKDTNLYLASDILALNNYSNNMYIMEDQEIALLNGTKNKLSFFDFNGKKIKKTSIAIDVNSKNTTKAGYPTFMEKEINDIPKAIDDTLNYYTSKNFNKAKIIKTIKDIDFIYFVACGTAYHAGLIGAQLIETDCKIRTKAILASEFRYLNNIINKNTLCIFLSQSGETADTLAAVNLAKEKGAKVVAITNVTTSSITRTADIILPTIAGSEIAVASTKAYNTQLLVLYLLNLYLAEIKNLSIDYDLTHLKKLSTICKININNSKINDLPKLYKKIKNVFFIGRTLDNLTAQEGSLKLKEISYINSEAYPAGELKHGTLALIDEYSLVIAIITKESLKQKTLNAVHEVKARGANVIIVSNLKFEKLPNDTIIKLSTLPESLMPIISILPLQELALSFSLSLGLNPDKPRNLAKSVTVE